MVYIMEIYCDGGCRNNGSDNCYGAAAAVFKFHDGRTQPWTVYMDADDDPAPTNQRAELTAIIIALKQALAKYDSLRSYPYLQVTIYSDSRYAVGCMTQWLDNWKSNGWLNARGMEVANRDLIEEASDLDERLRDEGSLRYTWIPRSQNSEADQACNDRMDQGY